MIPGAFEEAIAWHTVGIVGNLGRVVGHGIGTGVAIRWRGGCFVVTANHVIEDTRYSTKLWLLFRDDESVCRPRVGKAPRSAAGEKILRVGVQFEGIYRDKAKDLAVLRVSAGLDKRRNVRFYRLPANARTPECGTAVALLGYLSDVKQLLPSGTVAAFPTVEWTEITAQRPRADFDPDIHFFVRYASAGEREPQGFSGAGVWYSTTSGRARLAGIITHYYRKSRLLSGLRVETLAEFLGSLR